MKIQDKAKTIEIHSPKIRLPKHGYTKIELKDPYTCRKQVFESENMLTNAAENYFANAGMFNYFDDLFKASNTDNLVPTMFGGIMLFDDEIPENANNTGIPAANMTANMAYNITNNTNPPELGSYSATESGWQQDGSWVQVYNFTTTQGNGDIASACLTSRALGGIGAGNQSMTRKNVTNEFDYHGIVSSRVYTDRSFFKVNYDSSIGYAICTPDIYNKTLSAGMTIRVFKYLIPLSIINIKERFKLLETYTFTIPNEWKSVSSSYYRYTICDGKIILYGKPYDSGYVWDSTHPLEIMVIDETGIQCHVISTPPVEGLRFGDNDHICVFDGNVYFRKRTESGIDYNTYYKMRLSDGALLKTITTSGMNASNDPWYVLEYHVQPITDKQIIATPSSWISLVTRACVK